MPAQKNVGLESVINRRKSSRLTPISGVSALLRVLLRPVWREFEAAARDPESAQRALWAEIVQESNTLPPGAWVTRIARRGDELRALALERLVAANIPEADDGGVFSLSRWVNCSRSYPNVDGEAGQEIQSRTLSVL